MKKYIILALGLIATNVFANTGVFNGAGSQVMPIKNDAIQLKEEEVNFVITVPPFSGKYGAPFIPRVDVKAIFNLQNTSNHKEDLQIGFPFIDIQGMGGKKSILDKINFRVESAGKSYAVQKKEGLVDEKLDPHHLFKKIFAWQDSFKPKQTKQIQVSYQLDMSLFGMDMLSKLATRGAAIGFSYITGTAYTWRQPVEKAVFKFDLRSLPEAYELSRRKETFKSPFFSFTPLAYVTYELAGQWDKNGVTMSYKDKVPESLIEIFIVKVNLPAKADEIEQYLADLPAKLAEDGRSITKEVVKETKGDNDPLFGKKVYNEKTLWTNILNFYRGIYQGKMTGDMWSEGKMWGSTLEPEKKKIFLEHQSHVHFFAKEDRQEIKKIIAILEKKLGVSPSNLPDNPALDEELNKPTDSWLNKIGLWFSGLYRRIF